MKNPLAFSLLLSGLLTGCAAEAATDLPTQVVFDGKITTHSVDEKIREIASKPKGTITLVVKSTGGDASEAMRLGDAMQERRVSMVIEGYCHSACSSYLIPSATAVSIKGNAIVAFHGTPSFVTIPEHAPAEVKAYYDEFRKREEKFLTDRGVDYSAWLWVQSKTQMMCWFEFPSLAKDDINRYGRMARINLVVPSKQTFQKMGVKNITGAFPNSAKQAWEFATSAGFKKSISVAYIPQLDVPSDWTPPTRPECTDEIREEAGFG